MALAGIEDEPSYTRSKILNTQEETQTLLLGAEFVPQEYVTEKLLTLWGDGDKAQSIINQMKAEELSRFEGKEPEAIDAAEEALAVIRGEE